MMLTRPKWDFKDMTEAAFRRVYERPSIVSVTAKRELTSVDTDREWLTATDSNGKSFTMPENWRAAFNFVGSSSGAGLFDLNHAGRRMAERVREIDEWEFQNKKEREEYERLRKKFGDLTPKGMEQ